MSWWIPIVASAAGGAISSLMDRGDDTQEISWDLPGWWKRGARDALSQARGAARDMEFVGLTPEQQVAMALQTEHAMDLLPGTQQLQPVQTQMLAGDQLRNILAGNMLTPDTNPAMQAALDATTGQIAREFNRSVLPQIGSAAQRQGAWGGARQGLAEARASDEVTRNMADVAAMMTSEFYNRERAHQQQALQLAPAFAQADIDMRTMPAQMIGDVGNIRRDVAQEQQAFPMTVAQQLAGITGQLHPGGAGQTTTTSGPSTGVRFMQGAIGGAQLGNLYQDAFRQNQQQQTNQGTPATQQYRGHPSGGFA